MNEMPGSSCGLPGTLLKELRRYIFMKARLNYIVMLLVILAGCSALKAETVSRGDAKRIARMFFNEAAGMVTPEPELAYTGRRLTTDMLFNPFYVYNSPAGGFVIVAAENKAFPILGFNLKDRFNADKMSASEKALLRSYARDIELIRYDSREPHSAIVAWQNLPSYISSLLKTPEAVNDITLTKAEADDVISQLFASGKYDRASSDLFTPDQWGEEVLALLRRDGSVALGIANRDDMEDVVVYGKKGDYWRMLLDEPNQSFFRLFATELLSYGQLADIVNEYVPEPMAEAEPFSFYEEIIAEQMRDEERRAAVFEERLSPSEPFVTAMGGGHFSITLPRNAIMARTYNLNGAMVRMQTYSDTPVVFVDLGGQPAGFYFVVVNDSEGRSYGFKLYK